MKYIYHYFNAYKQMFNWEGKAKRTEFWSFMICAIIVSMVLLRLVGGAVTSNMYTGLIIRAYGIITTSAAIALIIRRAHDIAAIHLIPIMIVSGQILSLILTESALLETMGKGREVLVYIAMIMGIFYITWLLVFGLLPSKK